MAAVWAAEPDGVSAAALLADLRPAHGWGESTVRTLVHRLVRKGALSAGRAPGGGAVYRAQFRRDAWLAQEGQGVVDRVFGGQLAALVAHVTRARRPSPDDLAGLRRLVAELDAADDD